MEKDRFTNTIGLGYDKITDGQKESEKLKKKETKKKVRIKPKNLFPHLLLSFQV